MPKFSGGVTFTPSNKTTLEFQRCHFIYCYIWFVIIKITRLHQRNFLRHILLFRHFLEILNFELKIPWDASEQCFPVTHAYFHRKLTQNIETLTFELKTLKNESLKFSIFQTNQYGKQNSNFSMYSSLLMRYALFLKVNHSVFYYS